MFVKMRRNKKQAESSVREKRTLMKYADADHFASWWQDSTLKTIMQTNMSLHCTIQSAESFKNFCKHSFNNQRLITNSSTASHHKGSQNIETYRVKFMLEKWHNISMIIFYLVSCYNSWLHVEWGQIKEEGDYKRSIIHCTNKSARWLMTVKWCSIVCPPFVLLISY